MTDFESLVTTWDEAHPEDVADQHHLLDEIAHPDLVEAFQHLVD